MNNPPAFPLHNHGVQTLGMHISGMTLRDYMAAKAMQGLLAGLLADGQDLKWDQVAIDSYRQADAMLQAREQ
jgi:hypothetical protein